VKNTGKTRLKSQILYNIQYKCLYNLTFVTHELSLRVNNFKVFTKIISIKFILKIQIHSQEQNIKNSIFHNKQKIFIDMS